MELKKITQEELNEVVHLHGEWLYDNLGGMQADLSYTNMEGLNLWNYNLREANLSYANLRGANLRFTDLSHADIRVTDLSRADLRYTILSHAVLGDANLRDADLTGADLSQATLLGVRGLEVYSIDNVGTFKGKITYVPSMDRVYAGCWEGTTEDFYEQCDKVIESLETKLMIMGLKGAKQFIQTMENAYHDDL